MNKWLRISSYFAFFILAITSEWAWAVETLPFFELRNLSRDLRENKISQKEYELRRSSLSDSFKEYGQIVDYISRKIVLEVALRNNLGKSARDKYLQPCNYSFESKLPHLVHKCRLIDSWGDNLPSSIHSLGNYVIRKKYGSSAFSRVKFLGGAKFIVDEYCPKDFRRGAKGDELIQIDCKFKFSECPPESFDFPIIIRNGLEFLNENTWPESFPFSILPLEHAYDLICYKKKLLKCQISQIDFQYLFQERAFCWVFYYEDIDPPFDNLGRIAYLNAVKPEILRIDKGHYWVVKD